MSIDKTKARMGLAEAQREARHSSDALGLVLVAIATLFFFSALMMIAIGGSN